ncbi:unnamed protein product [Ectocarpus sp. 6 AP-2014]
MQVSARTIRSSSSSRKRSTITSNAARWVMLSLQQVRNIFFPRGEATTQLVMSDRSRVHVPTSTNARKVNTIGSTFACTSPRTGLSPLFSAWPSPRWERCNGNQITNVPKLIQDKRKKHHHKTHKTRRMLIRDETTHTTREKRRKHTNNTESQLIIMLIFRVYSVPPPR